MAEVAVGPFVVVGSLVLPGNRELGQRVQTELDLDVGALGDEQRAVAGLGHLGEEVAHLRRRLEVVLLAVELEAVGVVDGGPGLHAQQGVVRDGVGAVGVVTVVGGDERRAQPAGDRDEGGVGAALLGQAVVLELHEEVLGPEDVLEATRQLERLLLVAAQQGLEDDPTEASGGGDDPVVELLEQVPVEPGLVVVALEVRGRGQLHQVLVAACRLGQERQVVVELVAAVHVTAGVVHPAAAGGPLEARFAGHVRLGPDDRVDAPGAAQRVEVDDAVHVPVIGDPECGLAVGLGRGHQVLEAGGAVQHRVLGMGVQVRKRPGCHGPPPRLHLPTRDGP